MKKIIRKIFRFFAVIFKGIYKIIDKFLITPISKFVYFIGDKLTSNNWSFDKFLSKPNTLVYVSLVLAFAMYLAVDLKVVDLSDTEAVILTNQEITAVYNEEAFVVEGIPESADIVLTGRKSDLYLAEQLGDHKLTLDLTDISEGTHKVNLKYNNPINTLDYKLDPSRITLVVYEKVSESKTLTNDILNTDKLNNTLVISKIALDRNDVIVKSYREKLDTVASVKAIVDVNALNASQAGTYSLDNVKLVAYNEIGNEISDVEIVPSTVTATVTITSPSKVVPVNVIPIGEPASGSAISSITANVNTVTLYGEEAVLNTISEINVEIDVNNLANDKTYQETIVKPNGVRSISETAITIKVEMEKETSKEFENIPITFKNLDTSKYIVQATQDQVTSVTVVVKGVDAVLNKLKAEDITAYIDLAKLEEGSYTVPVMVSGTDNKLTYASRTTSVEIVIKKK
jgi:YbbR domain-containing protein